MTLDPRFTPYITSAAIASHTRFYPYGPFASITLAQWADESDYGAVPSGRFNFFGIKATPAEISAGRSTLRWTKEYTSGHYIRIADHFADYTSIEDGFDAHARLLISHHYLACMRATSPAAYAEALHLCGYATEPHYPSILMSIITANNLTQFDKVPTT